MTALWLVPTEVAPSAPGFSAYTPKLPRIAVDTNIVIDALTGRVAAARDLLAAGGAGGLEIAVSRTFDEEIDTSRVSPDGYVSALSRLSRPGFVIGHLRLGEAALGNDGAFGTLQGRQTGRGKDHSIRDEEHVAAAFTWAQSHSSRPSDGY